MSDFRTLSDDEVRALVRDNKTYADISRLVGVKISGASKALLATRILLLNIDTSHFLNRRGDKLTKTSDADFAMHTSFHFSRKHSSFLLFLVVHICSQQILCVFLLGCLSWLLCWLLLFLIFHL